MSNIVRYFTPLSLLLFIMMSVVLKAPDAVPLPAQGAQVCIKVGSNYLGVINDPTKPDQHGRIVILPSAPTTANFVIGRLGQENGTEKITIKSKELGKFLTGDNMRWALIRGFITDSKLNSLMQCVSKAKRFFYVEPSGIGFKLSVDRAVAEYLRLDTDGLRMFQPDDEAGARLWLATEKYASFKKTPEDFNRMVEKQPSGTTSAQYYYTKSINQNDGTIFEFVNAPVGTVTPPVVEKTEPVVSPASSEAKPMPPMPATTSPVATTVQPSQTTTPKTIKFQPAVDSNTNINAPAPTQPSGNPSLVAPATNDISGLI